MASTSQSGARTGRSVAWAEDVDPGGSMGKFDAFAKVPVMPFPGGTLLRWPTLVAAMTWFKLLDSI